MRLFCTRTGIVHTVNEALGEQGRPGQVVAFCGYGTVEPEFVDEVGPRPICKTCTTRTHTVDEKDELFRRMQVLVREIAEAYNITEIQARMALSAALLRMDAST